MDILSAIGLIQIYFSLLFIYNHNNNKWKTLKNTTVQKYLVYFLNVNKK